MEYIKRAPRRVHSEELRTQVLAQCAQPGASVAAVAMAHGLNANLVHKWNQRAGTAARQKSIELERNTGEFVALNLAQHSTALPCRDIRIELRRGATTMAITWPSAAAGECAAWMRELLR
jgi:transposase